MSSTVSVVVCAYTLDRWDDLAASLASAAAQVPAPTELLLVVDHNDALLERARTELVGNVTGLQVVANHRKQGLSGARNSALEVVTGEVVVFLDDDASAEPGWLAALLAPYADPAVIGVGGSARPVWPTGERRPTTLPATHADAWGELDWVVGCSYTGMPEQQAVIRNLMGCNMSMRADVFDQVGGFSEDLGRVGRTPLGCEETELCIRAGAARPGSRIVFEPAAVVRHRVSPDRLTWSYLLHRGFAEGLSKAAVATMVGADHALSSERAYATRVLPVATGREVVAALTGRHGPRAAAAGSAAAVVLTFAVTGLGYVRGKLARPTVLGRAVPRLERSGA